MIGEAIHVDTRHAQPQRNPALTGQLGQTAHRYPSQDVGRTRYSAGLDQDAPMATHYYAKTTYRANYFYWLLYALSIIASIFYFVVRIYYIALGKVRLSSSLKRLSKPLCHHVHAALFRCNLQSALVGAAVKPCTCAHEAAAVQRGAAHWLHALSAAQARYRPCYSAL